jgi:DoxX
VRLAGLAQRAAAGGQRAVERQLAEQARGGDHVAGQEHPSAVIHPGSVPPGPAGQVQRAGAPVGRGVAAPRQPVTPARTAELQQALQALEAGGARLARAQRHPRLDQGVSGRCQGGIRRREALGPAGLVQVADHKQVTPPVAQPELLGRAVPLLLRGSLGITFVWFGALKLAGKPTLPASLIAAITPMVDPGLSVPLVGAFEVVLGAGLLLGRLLPVWLAGAALQLSAPSWCCCYARTWPSWTATPAAERGGRVRGQEPGAAGRHRVPGAARGRHPTGGANRSPAHRHPGSQPRAPPTQEAA